MAFVKAGFGTVAAFADEPLLAMCEDLRPGVGDETERRAGGLQPAATRFSAGSAVAFDKVSGALLKVAR